MISAILEFLKETIVQFGPLGVFVASGVEEIIAPIPSALVLIMSGFFFLSGSFSVGLLVDLLFKVVIPATLGITLGSFFIYGIAYYFGQPFLKRWGRYLGITWESIEKAQQKFSSTNKDELTLLTVRAIPVIPSVAINAVCGLIRFPLRSYTLLTLIGVAIRATILGLIGWQVGGFYEYYANAIGLVENIILVSALVGFLAFVIIRGITNLAKSKIDE